jgi:hypothetical protein
MNGEKMIKNYQILKESINNIIQNSNLDIGAVYFILKDIYKEIEMMYYTQINSEILSEKEQSDTNKKESSEN